VSTDRNLTCADCGQEFVFTANEQDFYTERGFSDPRRCPACRQARKAQRGSTTGSTGGYSSGSSGYSSGSGGYSSGSGGYSSGGGGGYSSGGGGGGYSSGGSRSYSDRPPREMFEATCSSCGQVAKVPFRPTSGKPVYCTDCFAKRRA
jgi:CxxC-x17-CxxC domain-containing protein